MIRNIFCMFLIFAGLMLTAMAGSLLVVEDIYYIVRNIVLCAAAALVTIFSFQAGRLSGSFFYDDGEYPNRFLVIYLCGILCAVVFAALPATGWMFLFFYVALARVSDSITGLCGGTSLLVLTTVLCEQVSLSTFLVYLLSGMVGIALFSHQKDEFYTAVPLGLALGSQLLFIFAGELLIQNKKLVLIDAMIPFAGALMNGVLICIFLQYYINKVAKKKDNVYTALNNPECAIMRQVREKEPDTYYRAIHTAYLVERITRELGLDVRSAKCAAYYGYLLEDEVEEIAFPEPVAAILYELGEGGGALKKKESVIVDICYRVIREIMNLNKEHAGEKIEYGKTIEQMFGRQFTIENLAESEITLSNLRYIKKRMMEENVYYEVFMQRKKA